MCYAFGFRQALLKTVNSDTPLKSVQVKSIFKSKLKMSQRMETKAKFKIATTSFCVTRRESINILLVIAIDTEQLMFNISSLVPILKISN